MSTATNPMLDQALKFLEEKSYENAIEMLATYLQNQIEEHGDLSIHCAEAYFEYGNGLLLKEEDNPTDDLLGAAAKEAKRAAASITEMLSGGKNTGEDDDEYDGEDEDEEEEEDNGEGEGDEAGDAENQEEQPAAGAEEDKDEDDVTDLMVSWELLEVARKIYETEYEALLGSRSAGVVPADDPAIRGVALKLSRVYLRLGDLQKLNGFTQDSINEYNHALEIRNEMCAPSDRLLSELHYSLAVAHVYAAADQDSDKRVEKLKALGHYKESRSVMVARLQELKNQSQPDFNKESSAQDIHEASELVDELTECIQALESEISADGGISSSSSSSHGVTTIGFGFPSSSSSSSSSQSSSSGFFGGAKPTADGGFFGAAAVRQSIFFSTVAAPSGVVAVASNSTTVLPPPGEVPVGVTDSNEEAGAEAAAAGSSSTVSQSVLQVKRKAKPAVASVAVLLDNIENDASNNATASDKKSRIET